MNRLIGRAMGKGGLWMQVVLDTNVFISALLSSTGIPHEIYTAWIARQFQLITSEHQIEELRRTSRYEKFKDRLPNHRVGLIINRMRKSIMVKPRLVAIEIDDPLDAFLLGMAAAGEADYLVTGDKRAGLLAMGSYGKTRILTPMVFVGEVLA
jgi:uncharacterized protein